MLASVCLISLLSPFPQHNWTPLHFAAKAGYLEVVRLLVETGASCKSETKEKKIPLAFAAQSNHTEVLSYLLRREHSTLALMEDWKVGLSS